MQVYTKILIGMLVGAILGLLLGPNSSLLPMDSYKVSDWSQLNLRLDKDDPDSAFTLPGKPKKAKTDPPLMLHILAIETAEVTDINGHIETLPEWSKVKLVYTQQMALRDAGDTVKSKAGVQAPGETFVAWVHHTHTELQSGGHTVWPVPISGLGDTIIAWIKPLGDLFMRLIKMVIVPLVFSSLVVGIASLGDIRKLGRLGLRTLGFYMGTTAIAVTIGLVITHIFRPGHFVDEASKVSLRAQFESAASSRVEQAANAPSTIENILNIVPTNPLASLVEGEMLQVIFFAVMFGIALTLIENRDIVVKGLNSVQDAMVLIIHMVMELAPYGVAALIAEVVGTSGFSLLAGLAIYSVTVLAGLGLHGALVYAGIVRYVARLPVFGFLRAIRPAQLIAFSTSSSSATLPVTIECAEENLGVSNSVASFVLPLGSTVNMDGTALYQGVAAVFIAQVFGMDLSISAQIGIVLTATMASIGAAGVPGAGMVTLAMVLTTSGIPTVGVALILGVDRILDMFRTGLNVSGDLAVAAAMGRLEGDALHILTPDEDRHDASRGFESRLDHAWQDKTRE